jgi:hypothetical protein
VSFPVPKTLFARESLDEPSGAATLPSVLVDSFADSDDGDCTVAGRCNLRAAMAVALDSQDQPMTVYVPATQPHSLSLGRITVRGGAAVRVVGWGGDALITGLGAKSRFLSVDSGARVELAHLKIEAFSASARSDDSSGAAVVNRGSLLTYKVSFAENQAARGGAVFNARGADLVLRHTGFVNNLAKLADGHDIFNEAGAELSVTPCPMDSNVDVAGEAARCYKIADRVLSVDDLTKVERMAQDEGFAASVTVNYFDDSLDGSCGPDSTTCNLRAAVEKAVSTGTPTLIYISPAATHMVDKGAISIPHDASIKITGLSDLAVVEGSGNAARLFNVLPDGNLELSNVVISNFASNLDGGAVRNEGQFVAHRVAFVSGHGARDGVSVYNMRTCSLWYSTFHLESHHVHNEEHGELYVNPCETQVDVTGVQPLCVADLRESC